MNPMYPKKAVLQRFQVKEDPGSKQEMHISDVDSSSEPVVEEFELPRIRKAGDGDYAVTRAKYGALAATDSGRHSRSIKSARFHINALARDPLSIEREEQRIIAERVQAQVKQIEDKAKSDAAAVGYRDGLAKGHEEAFIRFQAEAKARLDAFEQLLTAAEKAKSEIFAANERFLIDMVFRVGRMVMLKELTTDRDYIRRLAIELIERVGVRDNIKLRVHPEEARTLGMLKQEIEKALGGLSNLSVEANPQIPRGGCVVETQWNAIEASLDRALQGISDSVIGKPASTEGSGGSSAS